MLRTLLLTLVVAVIVHCDITEKILDLEKLVTDRINAAANYQPPEDNREFKLTNSSDNSTFDYGTYDFIIVGAGSAGSVLAARLSEINNWNVLLLEAGAEETDFSDMPAMGVHLQFSDQNWGYLSSPQESCCLGMKSKQCNYPRGKVIGGSSTTGTTTYSRGNREDFDRWHQLGNPGWSYADVLPYFIKSENSQVISDPGFHGVGGPQNVAYAYPPPDTFYNFLEANHETGLHCVDYNGEQQIGTSRLQLNIRNGRRHSTGRAFLSMAKPRSNLNVTTKALVTKIILDGKIASGVTFIKEGKQYIAKAAKEVLVSAGAINSAQLLMLSGIGPKQLLEKLKIEVVEDLPVGRNLKDQQTFYGLAFRTNYTVTDNSFRHQIREYLDGIGPLTRFGNREGIAFVRTDGSSFGTPDLEFSLVNSNSTSTYKGREYNFDSNIIDNYFGEIDSMTDIRILPTLLHPKSSGEVRLKTSDPMDFPEIDVRYFSDLKDEDIETLHSGVQFIMKLAETQSLKKINATLVDIPICSKEVPKSKEFWQCAIRYLSSGGQPTGTTRMGHDLRDSVVNHELKVHGIFGLRVVGSGAFPTTTSGSASTVAIMMAEKISDSIKIDYNAYPPLDYNVLEYFYFAPDHSLKLWR